MKLIQDAILFKTDRLKGIFNGQKPPKNSRDLNTIFTFPAIKFPVSTNNTTGEEPSGYFCQGDAICENTDITLCFNGNNRSAICAKRKSG
jgi:hypothetical protein